MTLALTLSATGASAASPSVRTDAATAITASSAVMNGTVTRARANGTPIYYGFDYSQNANLSGATTVSAGTSSHTGTYSKVLTGLPANATFYYRAFVYANGNSGSKIYSTTTKNFKTLAAPSALIPTDYTNYDNTLNSWWELSPVETSVDKARLELVRKYNGYAMGATQPSKILYLTFNCGWENGYTGKILDVLKENGVPATFFVTGNYLKTAKALVQRMKNDGHIVGNHTAYHTTLPNVDKDTFVSDIIELDGQLRELGITNKYFRPPSGEYSERTLAMTRDLGYKTFFWTSTYHDYDPNDQKGEDFAYSQVVDDLRSGSIIMLHVDSKDNANALDRIIKEAKARGYRFGSLHTIK